MGRINLRIRWATWAICAVAFCAVLNQEMASRRPPLPVYGELPEFTLTNQHGQAVSLKTLRGQVWVVDIIFTRCPSQCVRMTFQMNQLQAGLPPGKPVKLVSLTTDPGFDTPAVFKKYAQRCQAGENWLFLTGDKKVINHLSIEGLKLSIVDKTPSEDENPNDLFIHSTKFVLVDKRGRVRGYYEGETGESKGRLLADLQALVRE